MGKAGSEGGDEEDEESEVEDSGSEAADVEEVDLGHDPSFNPHPIGDPPDIAPPAVYESRLAGRLKAILAQDEAARTKRRAKSTGKKKKKVVGASGGESTYTFNPASHLRHFLMSTFRHFLCSTALQFCVTAALGS